MRTRTVEVPREHYDDDSCIDVLVVLEVSGRDSAATRNDPPEYREAEVVRVVEDTPERRERPDLLPLYELDDRLYGEALELDDEANEAARSDAEDRDYRSDR